MPKKLLDKEFLTWHSFVSSFQKTLNSVVCFRETVNIVDRGGGFPEEF